MDTSTTFNGIWGRSKTAQPFWPGEYRVSLKK
jgi:hypothetical protein